MKEHWAWVFNVRKWNPSQDEYTQLLSFLQPEEQMRISRFRFDIDRKRALAGRILIRKLIMEAFNVLDNGQICLSRSSTGKPFLVSPKPGYFNFNLSHHGSWVALVGHSKCIVGVDVMEYELPKGDKSVSEFFHVMRSSFTPDEWKTIRHGTSVDCGETDMEQLKRFYKVG